MYRSLPLLCLASCGVFGLSTEQQQALAGHQQNASTYYGANDFDQALDQCRRGLEIDPDDYRLHYTRAWCLLRQSQTDPRVLPRAVAAFDETMALRGDDEQGPQARLGYAIAYSKLGLDLRRQAETIRQDAARLKLAGDELASSEAEAAKLETESNEHFGHAEQQFQRLVDLGEQLLEAHYGLMQTRAWHGDYAGAVQQGQAYLDRVAVFQDDLRAELDQSMEIENERQKRIELNSRLEQEARVRAFLANLHFEHQDYELAIAELDKVLTRHPDKYNEYFNRARSLLAIGRRAEAKKDFEKFVQMSTLPLENPQIRQAVSELKGLQ